MTQTLWQISKELANTIQNRSSNPLHKIVPLWMSSLSIWIILRFISPKKYESVIEDIRNNL